jgi:hypothetical protein
LRDVRMEEEFYTPADSMALPWTPTCTPVVGIVAGVVFTNQTFGPSLTLPDGSQLLLMPYVRCPCGVLTGGYHHEGCEQETCPVCSSQVMACGGVLDDHGITEWNIDEDSDGTDDGPGGDDEPGPEPTGPVPDPLEALLV